MYTEVIPNLYAKFTDKQQFDFTTETKPCAVMFYLEKGSFEFSLGNASFQTALEGDIIVCPPYTPLSRKVTDPVTLHVFNFTLPETYRLSADFCRPHLDRLKQNLSVLDDGSKKFIKVSFTEKQLHYLLDCFYTLTDSNKPCLTDSIIENAKDIIKANLQKNPAVKELAAELGLTPVALIRRFTASEGITPKAYIISERLRIAENQLTATTIPIEEIAQNCGYENGQYFALDFKKHRHCTPSEYRRKAKL